MKITVVPEDNIIIIDGDVRHPAGFVYPPDITAIQWDGLSGKIEYVGRGQEYSEDMDVVAPYVAAHAAAPLTSRPAPTFAELRSIEWSRFKADRDSLNNRMASMAVHFMAQKTPEGDAAVANIISIRTNLIGMLKEPAIADATDIVVLRALMKSRYRAIVGAATPAVYAAYKELDS